MRIWTNYIKRVKFWLEGGQASSLPPLFDFGTLFSFSAMFEFSQVMNKKGSWNTEKSKENFWPIIYTQICIVWIMQWDLWLHMHVTQQEAQWFSSLPKLGILFRQHWSNLICKLQKKNHFRQAQQDKPWTRNTFQVWHSGSMSVTNLKNRTVYRCC